MLSSWLEEETIKRKKRKRLRGQAIIWRSPFLDITDAIWKRSVAHKMHTNA